MRRDAGRLEPGARRQQGTARLGGRRPQPRRALVRRAHPGAEPQRRQPAPDGLERPLRRPGRPGAGLRARVGRGDPDQHDRAGDTRQVPGPAGRGRGPEGGLPRRFQKLEPLHLVTPGFLQVVRLDPDDDMPAGDRNRELAGALEQVLIDRGV